MTKLRSKPPVADVLNGPSSVRAVITSMLEKEEVALKRASNKNEKKKCQLRARRDALQELLEAEDSKSTPSDEIYRRLQQLMAKKNSKRS